jgi:5-methyltetrahydrofolate--homocysteine methyltransferase
MTNSIFLNRINSGEILVADGATGTTLFARGMQRGATSETWVMEQPDEIIQLHKDFITAGADIILTSTFGGTSIRLRGSTLEGQAVTVNQRAVSLARQAVEGTPTLVAGSLGPVGQLLKPYGPLETDDVITAYTEQAQAITQAGADLLVVETQFDMNEVKAAIQGVRSVSDLPLVVSLSYDRGERTMMGVSPSQAGKELDTLPVDVIGVNCGRSLYENLHNLVELRKVTSKPIWFKPNAGLPRVDAQGATIYDTTPDMMGTQVPAWITSGAQIVGGCCGTSPDYLRKISEKAKNY